MKYTPIALVFVALGLSACNSNSDSNAQAPASNGENSSAPKSDGNNSAGASQARTGQPENAAESDVHVLQITALNFLQGGSEPCDVRNKIFSFSKQDQGKETLICQNSKVKVYAVSDSGNVTFHAVDILSDRELPPSSYSGNATFALGERREMLRYGAQSPYGFTYLMADEVTGIDRQLLAQWNELSGQLATLRAQALTAQRAGNPVPSAVLDEMRALEARVSELAE